MQKCDIFMPHTSDCEHCFRCGIPFVQLESDAGVRLCALGPGCMLCQPEACYWRGKILLCDKEACRLEYCCLIGGASPGTVVSNSTALVVAREAGVSYYYAAHALATHLDAHCDEIIEMLLAQQPHLPRLRFDPFGIKPPAVIPSSDIAVNESLAP
jgi:hypothetical protein